MSRSRSATVDLVVVLKSVLPLEPWQLLVNMADYEKIASIRLKSFLLLLALVFAGSATLLSLLLSAAATETGSSPATAITLTEGENTGVLGPAGQRWFRIVPGPQPVPAGLPCHPCPVQTWKNDRGI